MNRNSFKALFCFEVVRLNKLNMLKRDLRK